MKTKQNAVIVLIAVLAAAAVYLLTPSNPKSMATASAMPANCVYVFQWWPSLPNVSAETINGVDVMTGCPSGGCSGLLKTDPNSNFCQATIKNCADGDTIVGDVYVYLACGSQPTLQNIVPITIPMGQKQSIIAFSCATNGTVRVIDTLEMTSCYPQP